MNYYSEKDIRDIVAKVVNSSLVTAQYFQRICRSGEKVMVVGEEPIQEELLQH